MLGDSGGRILSATSHGFTIPLVDGTFTAEFEMGMTEEHWDRFSPIIEDTSKSLLAEGILANLVRPATAREWDEAWEPLRMKHGPDKEEWLPQLVEEMEFDAIAHDMKEAIATFRQTHTIAIPIVRQDSTGLWHSDDYRVCKDKAGTAYNCTPVVAKLIEVLNVALKQGISEVNGDTLLKQAKATSTSSLANQISHIHYQMSRLDHLFARCKVWRTLVRSGVKKGCYRLVT